MEESISVISSLPILDTVVPQQSWGTGTILTLWDLSLPSLVPAPRVYQLFLDIPRRPLQGLSSPGLSLNIIFIDEGYPWWLSGKESIHLPMQET